jgi:hypothetical protein
MSDRSSKKTMVQVMAGGRIYGAETYFGVIGLMGMERLYDNAALAGKQRSVSVLGRTIMFDSSEGFVRGLSKAGLLKLIE